VLNLHSMFHWSCGE